MGKLGSGIFKVKTSKSSRNTVLTSPIKVFAKIIQHHVILHVGNVNLITCLPSKANLFLLLSVTLSFNVQGN